MKGKTSQRVKSTAVGSIGIPRVDQMGTITGPGETHIAPAGETEEEKIARCISHSETHTQILWDGNAHSWSTEDSAFELLP